MEYIWHTLDGFGRKSANKSATVLLRARLNERDGEPAERKRAGQNIAGRTDTGAANLTLEAKYRRIVEFGYQKLMIEFPRAGASVSKMRL